MPTVKTLLPKQKCEEKLIRVAAYCRVSSDSTDQQHSFAAQVKHYTEFIGENPKWSLADIYADEGITGTSMSKRDEFNRMIADCKRGKIDRIITKSVSRFARNTVDCLNTVRMLSGLGISVMFEKEHIDTAKMSSEILLAMAGTQAQDESISISGNMRWSYEKRMKSGEFVGCRAPYGYDLKDGTLVINEHEAEIIRIIFDMFLSGVSKPKIAEYLNENKVLPKYGQIPWCTVTVTYILNNERYIGDALLQKKYTTDTFPFTKKFNHGERAMYYVENSHPAIIAKNQFEAVKTLQQHRKHERIIKQHKLSKLLICKDCGSIYRRIEINNVLYWKCSCKGRGESQCTSIFLTEENVCRALIRMINILQQNYDQILKPMITALELLQSKANGTQHKVYEVDKEIAETNTQIHLLSQLQLQGILDPSDFAAQSNELSNKVYQLRAERMKLLRQNDADDNLLKLKEVAETIAYMDKELTEYDEDLIRSIVEKIIVKSSTEIEIHLFGGLIITEHLPSKKRRCKEA